MRAHKKLFLLALFLVLVSYLYFFQTHKVNAESATTTYNFIGVDTSNDGIDPNPLAIEHDSDVFPWTSSGKQNDSSKPNSSEYSNISADNTEQWATDDPGRRDEMAITFEFYIQEALSDIEHVQIRWNGNTDNKDGIKHSIWLRKDGFDEFGGTDTWVKLGGDTEIDEDVDTDVIRNFSSGFSTYINSSTGHFEFVVTHDKSSSDMHTNYIEVNVRYASVSPPSPPPPPEDEENPDNGRLSSYAWSENIGWISFNCENQGVCSSVDYRITVNKNTGDWSGHAWSENIGWIDFEPSGPYPGDPDDSAKYDFVTGRVNGWARAIAGGVDGWDGWIKMSGTNYSVDAVIGDICSFDGWAWGSDVIGWIHFSDTNYSVTVDDDFCVLMGGRGDPVVDAGLSHALVATIGHTHTGAEAKIGGSDDLASYVWEFDSCPSTCPTLSGATGILFEKSAIITGPSYTPNISGDYVLRLTVLDISSGSGTATVIETAAPPPPDFTLQSSNDIFAVKIGPSPQDSTTTKITVIPFGGFLDAITLSVESVSPSLPSGVVYNFSDPLLTESEYATGSDFWVRIPADTVPGNYMLTIRGGDGGLVRNVTVQLIVTLIEPEFKEVFAPFYRFLALLKWF